MEHVAIVSKPCLDLKSLGKPSCRQVVITSDDRKRDYRMRDLITIAMV